MPTYSYAQLQQIWISNGGSATTAPVAAAVALAESSGRSDATNHNTNGTWDMGLWQINGGYNTKWFDVNAAAREAIRQSNNGKNWRPWCTAYTDGACGTKGGSFSVTGSPAGKILAANGGKFATASPGQATSGGSGTNATATQASYNPKTCAFGIDLPQVKTPSIGPIPSIPLGGSIGFCVISRTQARALIGGLLIAAGGFIIVSGAFLLIAYGLSRSKSLKAVAGTAAVVTPGGKAVKVASAVAANKSSDEN